MGTFRNRLQALRARNLGGFRTGAEVYFLEDLKSSRIACDIDVSSEETPESGDESGCWKELAHRPG